MHTHVTETEQHIETTRVLGNQFKCYVISIKLDFFMG